ncbi:phospholipase B [Nadsonia fulvescens var. elongata DSM 6958]|uniref:Lysophospholipase n=1 Tax=Nadsonia fulvescens var. elongata DSM 6958 TaxID=857566 RepID=A0A1E3PR46_9ASCO|nr:phospholipase B [Nadsonia fulvescens var. elongata DSM 6958]
MVKIFFLLATLLSVLSAVVAISSPSGNYAPGNVSCPSNKNLVRVANSLNANETEYVENRHNVSDQALVDFLKRANLTDIDAESFLKNVSLNIGVAFSGGGYRAMLSGAGALAAIDDRVVNSTQPGGLGGLLQASTYIAGLSGGSWLVGSFILNNYTSVPDMVAANDYWDFEHSIFNPGGWNVFSTSSYWDGIVNDIEDKQKAGFNISLTDIWGRALSTQFLNTDYSNSLTWNTIRQYDYFKNYSMPFPIVIANGRAPDTRIISENSTVFEFTPYELGSWDPSVYAFTEIDYLGTNVLNGEPQSDKCIAGFDNAGFVMGTSSTLFNQFLLQLNSSGVSGSLYRLAENILTDLDSDSNDIAIYAPNPFRDIPQVYQPIRETNYLDLVDGGEDGQNIPLYPMVQPERKVDVIFAFDNTADTEYYWPNGSSLVATYERQFVEQGNGTIFPYVPDTNTFINKGFANRPTFFGCNINNMTSLFNASGSTISTNATQALPPLIVYIPNQPYSFYSNTSTFKMSYDDTDLHGMVNNGYNIATRANGTLDANWSTCVGCAILSREADRRGISLGAQCEKCFSDYCWDGTLDNDQSKALGSSNYQPSIGFAQSGDVEKTSAEKNHNSANAKYVSQYHWVISLLVTTAFLF